jgi:hypothetical protein
MKKKILAGQTSIFLPLKDGHKIPGFKFSEAVTSNWMNSKFSLGAGISPEIFYEQFLSKTHHIMGQTYHYYMASDIGTVYRVKDEGQTAAQIRIMMKEDNVYEAWYTEYDVIHKGAHEFSWGHSYSKVINGKWFISGAEVIFEGLGVGRGFQVIRTNPQIRFVFFQDIISKGIKNRAVYVSLVKTLDGEERLPSLPQESDESGGMYKEINFCDNPRREKLCLKESLEFYNDKKIGIDIYIFDETYYAIAFKVPSESSYSMYFLSGIWLKESDDKLQLGTDATLHFVSDQWHIGFMYDLSVGEPGATFYSRILYDLKEFRQHLLKSELEPTYIRGPTGSLN